MKNIKGLLALVAVIAFMVALVLLFNISIPSGSKDLLLVLLGGLLAVVKDIYGYYFGSSEGSRRKTELMTEGKADA